MGITKSDLFSEKQNNLAAMARVLAHPARIAILEYLLETNQCINGDLVSEFGLAQPTISQHLKELRSAGLIKGNVDGPKLCYCIDVDAWMNLKKELVNFFDRLDTSSLCC